jgi:hypothetical protein
MKDYCYPTVLDGIMVSSFYCSAGDYCYPTVLDGIMVSSFYCSAGNFMAGLAPEGSAMNEQKHRSTLSTRIETNSHVESCRASTWERALDLFGFCSCWGTTRPKTLPVSVSTFKSPASPDNGGYASSATSVRPLLVPFT